MKKLLLLGGSRYAIPVIDAAHRLGAYVVTADFLPGNVAHAFSDEYMNVSIIEKEKVLALAQNLNIDGVMSFACDPGVVAAAYIAERMGLPFQCSYESASILQDKGLFRQFLFENGFNTPHAKRYSDKKAPFGDVDFFTWPVIVKPVDSAGSKGVTKVDSPENLKSAIDTAVGGSHNGHFIIEDFLTFKGHHSSTDPFTVNGELKFITYSDQLFDKEAENPYTPAKIVWPSSMERPNQDYLTKEIQRLMHLLGMKSGIYNIESCVDVDGKPYIMEVSPRGGGCKIAELQRLAYGVDLIDCEVRAALGLPLPEIKQTDCDGFWCEFVIHARPGQSGVFKRLEIDDEIRREYVKLIDMTAKEGDKVLPFTGANMALGDMFLRFESREQLDEVMSLSNEWCRIVLNSSDI